MEQENPMQPAIPLQPAIPVSPARQVNPGDPADRKEHGAWD
jgi:hypothetical protein